MMNALHSVIAAFFKAIPSYSWTARTIIAWRTARRARLYPSPPLRVGQLWQCRDQSLWARVKEYHEDNSEWTAVLMSHEPDVYTMSGFGFDYYYTTRSKFDGKTYYSHDRKHPSRYDLCNLLEDA